MDILILLFHVACLLVVVWLVYYVTGLLIAVGKRREQNLDYRPVEDSTVEASVKSFGRSTNTIINLYGKLSYFQSEKKANLVGYVSMAHQNVAINDPLCSPKETKETILEFAQFTQSQDKDCLLFPIDQITARQASEIGFGVLQIGKEPVFLLKEYFPEKHDPKILSSVRQVAKKGVTVSALNPIDLKDEKLGKELEEILNLWFLTRKSEKMQLISEVSPFKYSEEKKYFVARSENRIEAFLACSPIFAKNGFFIHDLIRRPTAINGISEALIIQALTTLKNEGYDFATLGIASLSGLDEPGVNSHYPLVNKLLVHTFNTHEIFMNFKSLYHFKKKFGPTSEEPAFIAFYPPKFKISYAITVGGMFSGRGLIGDVLFKWKRWKEGNQLPKPLLNLLSSTIATLPRPTPFTFGEFMSRLRFTFLVFCMNIYTYMNTTSVIGEVTPEAIRKYGFNFREFYSHKWLILVTSNFIHFNYFHLLGNMFLLLVFCGTLEFIGGSFIAALAYLISMNADAPMGMVILPLLKLTNGTAWEQTVSYMDVGASLGIMGACGALMQFLKYKGRFLSVMALITLGLSFAERKYFGLDHTFALFIGYTVAHYYLKGRRSAKTFRSLLASYDSASPRNSSILFRGRNR